MQSPNNFLATHMVDNASSAIRKALLYGDGLAFFSAAGRNELLTLAKETGTIYIHRDADADGVCTITHSFSRNSTGDLGFSDSELLLHTDSSAAARPPAAIFLWCESASGIGGESHFLSAESLVELLQSHDPEILAVLARPDAAVYYSGKDIYRGPVIADTASGIELRLRLDSLGYFSSPAAIQISRLTDMMESAKIQIKLEPGMGYAIRNDTWLHGRAAFTGGRRTMLRILLSHLH